MRAGPAASLFQREFFELMHRALKADGILCSQGESIWLHLPIIEDVLSFCRGLFPVVEYAHTSIPTYPSGQIGFVLCCKQAGRTLRQPARYGPAGIGPWHTSTLPLTFARMPERAGRPHSLLPNEAAQALRYYTPAMHAAAFVLPRFAQQRLQLAP